MAYEVKIRIEAESDLGEVKTAEQVIQKLNQSSAQANRQMAQGAEQATRAYSTMTAGLRNLAGAFGIAAGAGGAVQLIRSLVNLGDQLSDLSEQTGISVRALAGLRTLAAQSGTSIETVATGVRFMMRSLVEGADQTGRQAQAFQRLGISTQQVLRLMSDPERALETLAQRLSRLPTHAERLALAQDLAARSGAQWVPVLLQIAQNGLPRVSQETERGYKVLGDFSDAMVRASARTLDFWAALAGRGASALGFGKSLADELRGDLARSQQTIAILESLAARGSNVASELERARLRRQGIEITLQKVEAGEAARATSGGPVSLFEDPALTRRRGEALAAVQVQLQKTKVESLELARSQGDLTVDVRSAAVELFNLEKAAMLSAAANDKLLTPSLKQAIGQLAQSKIAAFDATEAGRMRADALDVEKRNAEAAAQAEADLGLAYDNSAKDRELLNQRTLQGFEIESQIAALQADRLAIMGHVGAADRARLEGQIQHLEKVRALEAQQGKDVRLRDEQILNEQARLQRLGVASINIGHEISRSVGDIFTATITGTLKLADVGQSALLSIGRAAGDFFTQILNKKLGFEKLILDNMRGLAPQMNGAFASGASAVPGGGLATGDGGPVSGLLSNFNIGGFNLGSIGSILTQGVLGFGLGSLVGGARPGSGIGGALGSLAGGAFGASTAGILGNFILPGIGGIVGGLLGSLFGGLFSSRPPKSTLSVATDFQGLTRGPFGFLPGTVGVDVLRAKRTGGAGATIAPQLEEMALKMAEGVTTILNLFPESLTRGLDDLIADANRQASEALTFTVSGRGKKFQRNLDAVMQRLPGDLFAALDEPILVAIERALGQAGFAGGILRNLNPPRGPELEGFITATGSFAELSAGLARVGSKGLSTFLPAGEFGRVGAALDPFRTAHLEQGFPGDVERLKQQLGPTIEFLNRAIGESNDLFGRGLIAAMEAAAESDARSAFLQTLGQGARDVIYQGITEAFIASAQFSDLLAPIQQSIRAFTTQAIDTGLPPDIGAFRSAILPGIEGLVTRADTLSPLIAELRRLSDEIGRALAPLTGSAGAGSIQVETMVINVPEADDPRAIVRAIEDFFRSRRTP